MGKSPGNIFAAAVFLILTVLPASTIFSQSQALDAQIEGFVYDQNGAAVPRTAVTATNVSTGFVRTVSTTETGFYRMPLMPLGTYRVVAETSDHMKGVREGVTLVTGVTVTIDVKVQPSEIVGDVIVTADRQVADPGKTDTGYVLTNSETANLPLVSRNPLNFVFQQPNVTGRPNRGFLQFPMVSANGYRSRVSYQLDGNAASDLGRAGVRLLVIPETFVQEVQFVAGPFAPEFGNTPGVIMNMVTPTGTNDVDGSVAYLFRSPWSYSRPFGFTSAEKLQDSRINDVVLNLGLPIVVDRVHLFAAYEQYVKDDKGIPNRLLTITEANKAALIAAGLSPSIFPPAVPTLERGRFMLFRTDVQLDQKHRLGVRFNHSNIYVENNIQGGSNTLERSQDVENADIAAAAQLASYSSSFVNEFRMQFARRPSWIRRNEFTGEGPSITIANVANFGSPEGADGPPWIDTSTQLQNNLTYINGGHLWKFGGGVLFTRNIRFANVFARYTFPTIQAYVNARSGTDPRSYTRYNESSGDAETRLSSRYWNLFVQDDWKITDRFKMTFGVRYDLYEVPDGDPSAALPEGRKFTSDRNNLAPRLLAVYAIRRGKRPTVVRGGGGLYYEQPWLDMYERALQMNGNPRFFSFSVPSDSPEAPGFPTVFPPGLQLSTQDIESVDPDLENLYAINANVQLEQAINRNTSIAIGYFHSGGRHIPVYRSINYIPIRYLADSRPVFSPLVNPQTRVDPRFNSIQNATSVGTSSYDALTVQLVVRSLRGVNISANYTLSKATDDAPERNIGFPNPTSLFLTNPFDRSLDHGRSFADQRHSFVTSIVAKPTFTSDFKWLARVLNDNQIAVIAVGNSGYAFNIVSETDLNGDGLRHDRPLGIKRNSGTTPPLFNLDLRYSRFIPIGRSMGLEVFADFTNVLNVNRIVQFNNVSVPTNADGEMIGQLPDFRSRNQSTFQESRQLQIGVRFSF